MKLNSRYFNDVRYNSNQNTIKKTSIDSTKLINEIYWYLKLPKSLQRYLPKIVNYSDRLENAFIEMEYIHWPTVSELFLNEELPIQDWKSTILPKIDHILEVFSQYQATVKYEDLSSMYITKSISRLKRFIEQNSTAYGIYKRGYLNVNGKLMQCPMRYLEENSELLSFIINQAQPSIIHGDLCFSNIFFNTSTKEVKLIDPRGSFGRAGIHGDQNYDIAKIKHSLSGYDHIISDKFQLIIRGIGLDFQINQSPYHQKINEIWTSYYHNHQSINVIEALLFLSMIPLHKGNYKKQLTMYALGVSLLDKSDAERRSI